MTQPTAPRQHSNAYNLFILILTIISLVLMVVMLLPLDEATIGLLQFYDVLICIIFMIDFFLNLKRASVKSDYLVKERGWLDLLGSIPTVGVAFKYSVLLRLARLSRLSRIVRLLRGNRKADYIQDILENRSNYAAFITILLTIIILASASVLVLNFEIGSPDAKILTGKDALWYSIVTITTVGYGDYYPVTTGGRVTAVFIMIAGVGIIGVLASLMSSLLLGTSPAPAEEEAPKTGLTSAVEIEISEIKKELAEIRQLLERGNSKEGNR
jgi:voltage-gated potassium channel